MDYVVFLALAPVALALLAAVCAVSWRRRERPEARALFVLSLLCAGWLIANSLEVIVPTPVATYRVAQVAHVFAIFTPLSWLVFAWAFTDRLHWLRSRTFVALVAFNGVTAALLLTTQVHGWMWASATYVPTHGLLGFRPVHGPWFYAHVAVTWAVMVAGSAVIVREYASASPQTRRVSALVAAGTLVPLLLSTLHLARVLPVQKDFTPLGAAVGAVMIAVGVTRYRFLAYRPVARGALVESMREGMLALDPDDRVMDVNPAFQALLGLRGPLIGRPIAEVLPPERLRELGIGTVYAAPAAPGTLSVGTSRQGEVGASTEGEVTLAVGGDERHYDLRVSPLAGRRGDAAGRLLLLHDITERRAARAALAHANAELLARNDELDAFSQTVAHDLKNPIHAIYGYAQILEFDGRDVSDDVREECLKAILDLSQRMAGIVDALLLLAGVNRTTVEAAPLAMEDIVPRALVRLTVAADRVGASVDGATPEALAAWPRALGYAPWAEEMWVNYLSNAVKYGGPTPEVRVGAERRGARVRFWVQDHGPGLSAEAQALLFRPFSRLDASRNQNHKGVGLGLAIARDVARGHGGDITLERSDMGGLRALIRLPG